MNNNYFKRNISALEHIKAISPVLREIAQPLISNTCIKSISYIKLHSNGDITNFSTDINWIKYRFENNIQYAIIPNSNDELFFTKQNEPELYFLSYNFNSDLFQAMTHFGSYFGAGVRILNKNELEIFYFTTDKPDMNNYFIFNFDLIKSFIIYFRNQIKKFEDQPYHLISTEVCLKQYKKFQKQSLMQLNTSKKNFNGKLKSIPIAKDISLTFKEVECCYYLLKGYQYKSIANQLEVSPRTIEHRVNSIKNKIDMVTKSSMIDYLHQHQWIINAMIC